MLIRLMSIVITFLITSCNLNNKYKKDRIFLDFHLGMTVDEYDEHIKDLLNKKDYNDFWTKESHHDGGGEYYDFRYRLFDNVIDTVYTIGPEPGYFNFKGAEFIQLEMKNID